MAKRKQASIARRNQPILVKNKLTIVGDNIQQCSRISESDSNAAAAAAFSRDIFRRITTVVQDFFLATDYNNRTEF